VIWEQVQFNVLKALLTTCSSLQEHVNGRIPCLFWEQFRFLEGLQLFGVLGTTPLLDFFRDLLAYLFQKQLHFAFLEIPLLIYSRNNFPLLFQRCPSLLVPGTTPLLCFFRDLPAYLFQKQLPSHPLMCSRNNCSTSLFETSPSLLVPGTTSLLFFQPVPIPEHWSLILIPNL